ncbi:Fc receptor-like protein 5 isoform X2 [Castor canadensis]|uniref:Fc receptor-like protein 5 isoform X2 n=1 Tax=Castor canadensis TaxID=51338 RepID=A0AC58KG52_CASCN
MAKLEEILAPVSGQFATGPKSLVSLQPPWTTLFEGEKATLTCYLFSFSSSLKTKWYRGETLLTETQNILVVRDSGKYRCQADNLLLSDPVPLEFSSASLILQAPFAVFEGDSVILRCQARKKTEHFTVTFSKNNKVLTLLDQSLELHIQNASLKDNGEYRCTGYEKTYSRASSNAVTIQVQELFPRPVLRARPSNPTNGGPITLTCETQLLSLKPNDQLKFCFFKSNGALESGCSSNPELHIPAIWTENSGGYWCTAGTTTSHIWKKSLTSLIDVQRALANVKIHTVPASKVVSEGQELTLNCLVERISGPIKVSWYKRDMRYKEKKTHVASKAEFKIPRVNSHHAGEYYCVANNSYRHFTSRPVTINVKVPVSQPILTLTTAKGQTFEGDIATLHCEAQRGSPSIVYQFYHENVPMGSPSTSLGREASFSFSLTSKHSGNYYCTADNGLQVQRSEAVSLFVTVPVSCPVLTLRATRAQTFVGDIVEFHCEALKGSPPILYQLYHEDVILGSISATSIEGASFNLSLTEKHSGIYFCEANNGQGAQRSYTMTLSVRVPVYYPVLVFRTPRTRAVVGDMMMLHCKVLRGSPPIMYQFYHEDIIMGRSSAPSGGGVSFNLSLTTDHSGNYFCEADNGLGPQRSEVLTIKVTVPVCNPVLTLKTPRAQAVVGEVVELHCEALRGSPPILYQFYHENVIMGSNSAPFGGGVSFNLSVTEEHSGNYSCEANNGLGPQHSEVVTIKFKVPVSRPVLTFRIPRDHAVVGDMVELHCEVLRGSPPILYLFYHEDVTIGNSSAPSGGGTSFNFSLTKEHSGNYSCEAKNGLWSQRSERVTLCITGLTGNRSGSVATRVTGGLLSMMGLAAGALLFYCWLSRKAGKKPASDTSRSLDLYSQEPTYHNVPTWIELQPVYSNVNPRGGDVVYSEVQSIQKKKKHTVASEPQVPMNKVSFLTYMGSTIGHQLWPSLLYSFPLGLLCHLL